VTGYDERAQLHRPRTPEGLSMAIRELRRQGLTARDIAQALRMPIATVLECMKA
jgi:hypothetical protein